MERMKVCFTGGGTGGHVFPAFAVDESLGELLAGTGCRYERFWIGSRRDTERLWVEQAGIRHVPVCAGKLRRYFSWRLVPDVLLVIAGFIQSLLILARERPDVLFSKGGYVSVPPLVAASLLGIPCVTHESDAIPGLATLLNARFARTICIPFEEARADYPPRIQRKLVVTGVPSRFTSRRTDARRALVRFGLRSDRPVVVVLGGSQGALQLNTLVQETLDDLLPMAQIVHQTGGKTSRPIAREGYLAIPFIGEELGDLLAAATIVVSRAGATAIADFMEMSVPMILVPLGRNASRGDQEANARRLASRQAAVVLEGSDIDGTTFVEAVRNLLSHAIVRDRMAKHAATLYIGDAARRIARVVVERST
jgi:UDP-N-acetylglucosamine--N-acetylmuramyl-(pentapeptide) pyrophosphoryl-undecaprenol N-acetylglucosamine transferase